MPREMLFEGFTEDEILNLPAEIIEGIVSAKLTIFLTESDLDVSQSTPLLDVTLSVQSLKSITLDDLSS